jgi:hypothetical protein
MNQFRSSVACAVPAIIRRRIQRLVRGAVPQLADFSLAYLTEGVGVTCVASAHVTRDGGRLVRALARQHRIRRSDRLSAVAQVFRSRRPLLRTAIRVEGRVPVREDDVTRLHRLLAPRSALVVPIADDTTIYGVVSLCYSESGRVYTRQDIPAAASMAGRIARLLSGAAVPHGTVRLRPAARDARQGTTLRRRVVPRN